MKTKWRIYPTMTMTNLLIGVMKIIWVWFPYSSPRFCQKEKNNKQLILKIVFIPIFIYVIQLQLFSCMKQKFMNIIGELRWFKWDAYLPSNLYRQKENLQSTFLYVVARRCSTIFTNGKFRFLYNLIYAHLLLPLASCFLSNE
jgi:hypothetical protein